jgi:hypothetical protein
LPKQNNNPTMGENSTNLVALMLSYVLDWLKRFEILQSWAPFCVFMYFAIKFWKIWIASHQKKKSSFLILSNTFCNISPNHCLFIGFIVNILWNFLSTLDNLSSECWNSQWRWIYVCTLVCKYVCTLVCMYACTLECMYVL